MTSLLRLLLVLLVCPALAWGQAAQVINGNRVHAGWFNYGTTGGSATAYTLTFSPAMPGYVTGQCFVFKPHVTNAGAATLNVQGLGAKSLAKRSGGSLVPLVAGDLLLNRLSQACYDGTDLQLMGAGSEAVGSGGHTIHDEGTARAAEPILNFVGTGISCVDSPGTSSTICTVSSGSGGHTIHDEGTARAAEPILNFVGTGISCVDSPGTSSTLCTVSSGGHTIQDEGVARATRANLNFSGAGVSCVDNAGANSTDCAVSGTGSGVGISGTPLVDQLAMWTNANTIKGISSLAFTVTDFDVATAIRTRPNTMGTTPPVPCAQGDTFYDTDAPTSQKLLSCELPPNGWEPVGGVATGSGVGISGTPLVDQLAMWTNANTIKGISSLAFTVTDFDVATAIRTRPNTMGTTPPVPCAQGDTFYDTDAPTSQKLLSCELPPNGWEPVGGVATGSGTVSAGTVGRAARYSATTTVVDSAGLTLDATDVLTLSPKVTPIAASMTAGAHNILACTSGTGTVVVTLPVSAAAVAKRYVVVKVDTGSGICRVAPATGEQLNWVVNGTQDAVRQGDSVTVTLLAPTFWLAEQGLTPASLATLPEVRSLWISAGSMEVSGACTLSAAAALVTNGPKVPSIACTDADVDSIEYDFVTPDGWNAGTITVELVAFSVGNNNGEVLAVAFAGQCVSSGDSPTAHSTTGEQTATITWGATANREQHATTAPITLQNSCSPGDHVYMRGQIRATPTTMAPMSDLKILGAKVEWTRISND